MGNEPEKNESSQAGAWEQEKKTGRFYAWLKKAYDRLITVRGQPREVALGFALGIFIGASPTMGFQMPIAVFFAAILKWNKISAAMGVWITNPITAPFFYGFTYLVGAKILGLGNMTGVTDNIDSVSEILSKAPEIVWSLIIGGVVVGLPLAVASYYFCYSAVRKYQNDLKAKLMKQKEKYREGIKGKLAEHKEKLAHKKEERQQKKKKLD
ncbi:MAG: hypothetical protein BWK80_28380 [Desulfobacteraceae bacterium IS3]|nr:MAG: hypothetical protein BWK80_28380 [Desulfobacteraceae bacterium IS3]